MFMVLYIIVSIIMGTHYTISIINTTSFEGASIGSCMAFALYFWFANVFAWPFYTIFKTCVELERKH